uniref:Uncharacterized protein n=1 Tax=Timema poppense TaxID=170557 RepID=A0A7R9HC21_TIMPO|nr:unnamed protein product [Timema poppensis]
MSWDFAKPSQEDNLECLPCIFIQFMVLENGARVSKILQVFSKQAVMMDTLITVFVEDLKQKTTTCTDETERPMYDTSTDSDGKVQENDPSSVVVIKIVNGGFKKSRTHLVDTAPSDFQPISQSSDVLKEIHLSTTKGQMNSYSLVVFNVGRPITRSTSNEVVSKEMQEEPSSGGEPRDNF